MDPAFEALGDATRRSIMRRLSVSPAAVGDIAAALPVSRPAVSQHLKVLADAGLVRAEAAGSRRIYRLDPRGVGAMRDWLDETWSAAMAAFATFADTQAEP
ncbi:MAG TPA: metalloregulator ArsR/SmtB family transcription factor [Caulobacteraceae bacterium]|nr:metalloregulator ArsR/SmtB family transcription factor [Caulobacteraceae bacterium]